MKQNQDLWGYVCDSVQYVKRLVLNAKVLIVGSLSESRLKSVRFLVEEISASVTSSEFARIIKINH